MNWRRVLAKFLSGQALIQAGNVISAIWFVRHLPREEYAYLVVAVLALGLGSLFSDLNLSTAFSTYASKAKQDKAALASLVATTMRLRRWLFILAMIGVVAVVFPSIRAQAWSTDRVLLMGAVQALAVWIQQSVTLRSSVLNVNHDSDGLFRAGTAGMIVRLSGSIVLCEIFPVAEAALACHLASVMVTDLVLKQRCKLYIQEGGLPSQDQRQLLLSFIAPLVPGAILFAIQGQVATLLIALLGQSTAVADVGALQRVGQVFALFGLLNGFFFQPVLARIEGPHEFVSRMQKYAFVLGVAFLPILASSILIPSAWLWIIGQQYHHLSTELAIAVLGSILGVFSGFLFTGLAARARTRGQGWFVVATLITQACFIAAIGVDTVAKAVALNLATALASIVVQLLLLWRATKWWDA